MQQVEKQPGKLQKIPTKILMLNDVNAFLSISHFCQQKCNLQHLACHYTQFHLY